MSRTTDLWVAGWDLPAPCHQKPMAAMELCLCYARMRFTPSAIYIFDHFMRESKYENHMFKVQSALRTSAALEFGEPARITKTIK